jgi:hypothetical protein
MSRSEQDQHAEVVRLARAVVILCDGYEVAISSVAMLYAAIALCQAYAQGNRNLAIERLRSQLANMKDPEPGGAS